MGTVGLPGTLVEHRTGHVEVSGWLGALRRWGLRDSGDFQVKASPAARKPTPRTQFTKYKPAEGTAEFAVAKEQRKSAKTTLASLSLYE